VVGFIGKWAAKYAGRIVSQQGIPFDFMNRQRSLNSALRIENCERIAKLLRQSTGSQVSWI
jgi:hypothetical protein